MRTWTLWLLLLSSGLMAGCAAMLVPETKDPIQKLKWAQELYGRQARPLPAERLINEAITICSERGDVSCMGQSYLQYGFFFRSPSINKWQSHYEKDGFYDKSATYNSRLDKSKEYFLKAVQAFNETKEYDKLTNAYLNLGFTYYFMGDHVSECGAYSKSLTSNAQFLVSNPLAKTALPPGYTSYEEYVADQQKRAGCLNKEVPGR